MDDRSPTHAFPRLHLPQPLHAALPERRGGEPGCPSAQPPLPQPGQDDQTMPRFQPLDEGFDVVGHFEEEEGHAWCIQKDAWDGHVESSTDECYTKGNCYGGHRGATSYDTYNSKANTGYATKQTSYFGDGELSLCNIGLDYSRSHSVTFDLDREVFGSNLGSNKEQFQSSEVDTNHWLTGAWKGESCTSSVAPQKTLGLHGRTHTQKLDSFSEAFMSQARRQLPVITSADAQVWDGAVRPRLSCSLDSDSSSPSLPSFPSPPTSNLLSPPPTPLPPASHSPSKVDSPSGGGLSVHAGAPGGEGIGAVRFFPVRPQSLHGSNSPGTVWRFPLFLEGESSGAEGNARASVVSSFNFNTGPNNVVQSLVSSSPLAPGQQSPRALCSPLHDFFHSASLSSLPSNHQNEENATQTSSTLLGTSHNQDPGCPVYTGTTFPSMLRCDGRQRLAHFTPRPLLNPLRKGPGLHSSICCDERGDSPGLSPCINVGADFQANIPPCLFGDEAEEWSHDEEGSPWERLLWKPWAELIYSATEQDQVEKLLKMSSSSCLPGGGANTELALHCLHQCHGDIMATLEMLLLSQPVPAGDYHYSGADVWTEREKRLFTVALETHGKDFSLIQALVKTKTVSQCVELYYLRKKMDDKQKTLEEESRVGDTEQRKNATPAPQPITRAIRLPEMLPLPLLASSFPCKLCGKMFYKIKSRNAHMKIHRQPQEDWTERKLQQQMMNQALNCGLIVRPQAFTENNISNSNSINLRDSSIPEHMNVLSFNNSVSHVVCPGVSAEPASVLHFQPVWSPFGQNSHPPAFYSSAEKMETEGGTVKWK